VFSVDIPVNNCVILQSGNDLELLPAGQYCITHPNVTLRGVYTLDENQFEMPTKDVRGLPLFMIFLVTDDMDFADSHLTRFL
jgi:hypothetical protein